MDSILTFIAGPWGTLIGKVMMGLTLAAMIYVGVSQYNNSIRETQKMRDQQAQLVQLEKDNQVLKMKMANIEKINSDILVKLDQENLKVVTTHDKVTNYITSPEAQKTNRLTSDVIKNTVGMLKNEK
jgi:hypothetical protein